MKTERLVILVTPRQKRVLVRRARALGLSVAELLRRSTEGLGAGESEDLLVALAGGLRTSVRESRAALRAALSEAEATLEQFGKRREERRVA